MLAAAEAGDFAPARILRRPAQPEPIRPLVAVLVLEMPEINEEHENEDEEENLH